MRISTRWRLALVSGLLGASALVGGGARAQQKADPAKPQEEQRKRALQALQQSQAATEEAITSLQDQRQQERAQQSRAAIEAAIAPYYAAQSVAKDLVVVLDAQPADRDMGLTLAAASDTLRSQLGLPADRGLVV